jgi:hypothetical protein
MAHPFFDALTYPLERPEAVRLRMVLLQAITLPARIDDIYNQCQAGLPPLALVGVPPDVIWTEALRNLTARGALRVLCDRIVTEAVPQLTTPAILAAVREVINAEPSASQQILSESVLVLDRVALRGKLEKLESDTDPVKVILVRGEPDSGKSHGRYLFRHVADNRGAQAVYLRDGTVATVDEVIVRLFSTVEAEDKIPPRDTSLDAWFRSVCTALLAATKRKQRPLWIAMDGLGMGADGAPLLDPQIREFFNHVAFQTMDFDFGKWFRLMLINYPDGPEPAQWESDFWTDDRTSAADIQQEHVVALLQKWLQAHDRNLLEAEVLELAKGVIAKADAPPAPGVPPLPRLRIIHDAVKELIANLSGTPV